MLRAQSSIKFHLDTEIERKFFIKKRRQLFKSKTNPNIEKLDPYFKLEKEAILQVQDVEYLGERIRFQS